MEQQTLFSYDATEILCTRDYTKFSFMLGNREVDVNDKKSQILKESIRENGIMVPIIVNEKHDILDGQHRFTIAEELKIEVPYVIREGFDLVKIQELNATHKPWTIRDCINSGLARNMWDYVTLNSIQKETKLELTFVASLLQGKTQDSKITKQEIQTFCYRITHLNEGKKVIHKLKEIKEITKEMNRTMMRVLSSHVLKTDGYDHERMLLQLKRNWAKEKEKANPRNSDEYGKLFQKIYNLRQEDRLALYVVL